MSDTKTLSFINLDIEKFLGFIINSDIKEIQIIDFTPDKIKSKAHPIDNSYIKYTVLDVPDVLEYKSLPENFKLLKFPFYRLKRIKDTLTIYNKFEKEKIDGEILYEEDEEGVMIGLRMKFKAPKMNISVNATEMYMTDYMTDKEWENYSNKEDVLVEFDMDKEFTNRIKSLCNLEGDDNTEAKEKDISIILDISKTNSTVTFRSKDKGKWDIEYNPDKDGKFEINSDKDYVFYIPKKILDIMGSLSYKIYVVWNKKIEQHVLMVEEDENNIILKGLMEFDASV